jgi:hypothetical protein
MPRPPSLRPAFPTFAVTPSNPPSAFVQHVVEALDAEAARSAFEQYRVRAADLPADALARPTVSVRGAALTALAVATRIHSPGSTERDGFVSLARENRFELSHLDELAGISRGAWYVAHRLSRTCRSNARVPEDVLRKGEAARMRMLAALQMAFARDTDVGRRIARVRVEGGHEDLIGDLFDLAELHLAERPGLVRVQGFYRETDTLDAITTAEELLRCLGTVTPSEFRRWNDLQARFFTLLEGTYGAVRAAGATLFCHDPGMKERFPDFHAGARSV